MALTASRSTRCWRRSRSPRSRHSICFGEYLEHRAGSLGGLQSLLWGLALAFLVLSCAARSPAAETQTLPPLGASALAACLVVFGIKLLLAAAPHLRRLSLHPAKPRLVQTVTSSAVQNGSAAAAECATSISGWTAKNEPTVTTTQIPTPRPSRSSRGGEPPAGASCSSAASRKYMARTIPR